MTLTHLIRFAQALVLAAIVAALAAPAVLGSSTPGKPAPDWVERYAEAHLFGQGAVGSAPALDVFERYAAARGVTVLTNG